MKLFLSLFVFLFLGCQNINKSTNYYALEKCHEEILADKDYIQENAIDHILVIKKERKMYLYQNGIVEKVLPISLGKNPIGHKQKRGDNKTPEGKFFIKKKLCSPKYYRSLCISYPRVIDIENAKQKGVDPGGSITIHAQPKWNANGKGNAYTLSHDWTQGCIAITNDAMKSLWYQIDEGVPIEIR